jgi:hypothetical protein
VQAAPKSATSDRVFSYFAGYWPNKTKVGLLELAKQFGNVSQSCRMMGYRRDSF